MAKIKIGVFGVYRGTSMINFLRYSDKGEIVAICDKWKEAIDKQKSIINDDSIAYYDNFDEFIKHDMDAVVLANYATEHAPYAIKAMKAGKHVYSEVLPCQTMKEAVELVETVEETGKIYCYGENYCYLPATREMKKLYQSGKLGEFEYAEGEYIHNCYPIWHSITYGDESHWRNNMYSTFYCTHSIGPIVHITKQRPVSVIGIEGTKNARNLMVGAKGGAFGISMITFENGGIMKNINGCFLNGNSIWYSLYGSKGKMESEREGKNTRGVDAINVEISGEEKQNYLIKGDEKLAQYGHNGSDYFTVYNFIEAINGNKNADIIDVYEALDMFLPGLFAYRSILQDGKKMKIPNLRNKEERDLYKSDTACVDSKVAGEMLLPTTSLGTPEIDKAVYENMYDTWKAEFDSDNGYTKAAFTQSSKK